MQQPLRVHYFQHIDGQGFGSCEAYLRQHKHAHLSATEFYKLPKYQDIAPEQMPHANHVDLLIIMGGDMSVNDEDEYPWLKTQKQWIRDYVKLGKPIIGICLGSQMIASALGAEVKKNPTPEIGWTQLHAVADYPQHCFKFPAQFQAMEWHDDTFDVPPTARLLVTGNTCQHQAYQLGSNIIAMQFHPEMTADAMAMYLQDQQAVAEMVQHDSNRIVAINHSIYPNELPKYQLPNQILNDIIDYVLNPASDDSA